MTRPVVPGLCSVTFRTLTPDALIALAKDHGVAAIEWGADVHVPAGNDQAARAVAAQCRDAGIACPSYGTYVRAGTPGARDDFDAALGTARALGAGNLRVWAGSVSGADADAETWRKVADDLSLMADRAGEAGVTVSVEYHRKTLTETAEDAARLFADCDHANLFSYWQPVPGRTDNLAEIDLLQPWLGYVHVFHWRPAAPRDERRPLAEAEPDWRSWFAEWTPAPHWPHGRTAFLEFVRDDDAGTFAADIAVLRRLCAEGASPTE